MEIYASPNHLLIHYRILTYILLTLYIFQVIFKVVEEHPRDLAEGLDMIKVVFGDETIPSLYENSRVSQEQLPGQPGMRFDLLLCRFLTLILVNLFI